MHCHRFDTKRGAVRDKVTFDKLLKRNKYVVVFKKPWRQFNEHRPFRFSCSQKAAAPFLNITLMAPVSGKLQWRVADLHHFCHLLATRYLMDCDFPSKPLVQLRRAELGEELASDATLRELRDEYEED